MATQRGYFKEELNRAVNNIEQTLTHVSRLVEPYAEAHPEISAYAAAICDALVEIGENIQQLNERI